MTALRIVLGAVTLALGEIRQRHGADQIFIPPPLAQANERAAAMVQLVTACEAARVDREAVHNGAMLGRGVSVAALPAVVALLSGATAPAPAAPGPLPHVTVFGDSIAEAVVEDDSAKTILTKALHVDFEVAPCRRIAQIRQRREGRHINKWE